MALRTLDHKEWVAFLTSIEIPEEDAENYATKFQEQRLAIKYLKFITDEDLQQVYGIQFMGHRLAIRHYSDESKPSHPPHNTAKPQITHKPPQLKPKMTPSSFRTFKVHWKVYKHLVGLPDDSPDGPAQIFSLACSEHPEIRQTVEDYNPEHLQLTESDYLEMICKLLTAQSTPETFRHKFFSMSQHSEESCQHWLQRLKEVSPDCNFYISCNQKEGVFHPFDENLLRSKFILGLSNISIKQDLLAKSQDLKTLDSVFTHAVRMESTGRDLAETAQIIAKMDHEPSSSNDEEIFRISSYKQAQKGNSKGWQKPFRNHKEAPPCSGCGSTQHSSGERFLKCPAWKKVCDKCGKLNHFGKVCRAPRAQPDSANAIIASLKDHANKDNELSVTLLPKKKHSKSVPFQVYPDTGASLCVAGPHILKKLGMNLTDLEHTSRNIVTATGDKIACRGKFRASLILGDRSTVQEIYICNNIRRIFLSRTGCIELGIVHEKFPQPLHVRSSVTPTTPVACAPSIPQIPERIPYDPTPENIPLLKQFLLNAFSETAFNSDKDRYFPIMKGVPPAHIHLKPGAEPFVRRTPNLIPYFWRDAAKKLLDQHEKRGIIEKTPIGTATPWCFPMVITPKKSSISSPKLRMTVDLQNLNSKCVRELHHVESPFKLASQIPEGTYKTLLDAVDGYQAVELDKQSRPLTTFITPWGTYNFLRIPAGLIDSGDKYTSRYDTIIRNIPRKVKCVDDTLLFDFSISDAFYHTFNYLKTCAENGIRLNASKFRFCTKEIDFAGFNITPTGIKPSENTIKSIKEFPVPKSTTDVRSWYGLVRQVAYAHSVSEDLAPLRGLLKHEEGKKPKFQWNIQLQQAFERSKMHVIRSVAEGIRTFDPKRLTCMQCDWSKNGIGFLLLQKHCNCAKPEETATTMQPCCETGWKPVFAGSRFTNPAESRYAPTEGEALSVAWGLKKSRLFTLGCPNLYIVTDHKPLLGILNERDLGSIKNPRIRRLKEQTLDFNFQTKFCPGKFHLGADALSRYPVEAPGTVCMLSSETTENQLESKIQHSLYSMGLVAPLCDNAPITPLITLDKMEVECLQDSDYMELHELVLSGFPQRRIDVPNHAKVFWPLAEQGDLSTLGNIVLYHDRIVVPKSLRSYVVKVLHSAHQGCTGMISRATSAVFWPGMRKDVMSFQTNCQTCSNIAPSQPREPLQLSPLPERPFQVICADLFQLNNNHYLIVVDRFSGFLHIFYSRLPPTHKFIEKHLRDIFVRYGRPDRLETDGGPQFQSSEFTHFLKSWSVTHKLSSPYYPQSNSRAELGVKTAKRLLRNNTNSDGSLNNDKVACAVLNYHNTSLRDGPMSPAQLLFGRCLPDFLPVNPKLYELHPYWNQELQDNRRNRNLRLERTALRYNFGTRILPPLKVGQNVSIQNPSTKRWDRYGTVLKILPFRKYQIHLNDTGTTSFRNRRHLRPSALPLRRTLSGPMVPTLAVPNVNDDLPMGGTSNSVQSQATAPVTTDTELPPAISSQSSEPDTHQPTLSSSTTRTPRMRRCLRPFNNPGLKET